jgi:HK97 family phage major capsid protein
MSIQALRERRSALGQQARKMVDDNTADKWTPEIASRVDQLLAEVGDIDDQISAYQRVLDATADDAASQAAQEAINKAKGNPKSEASPITEARGVFQRWIRGGDRALSDTEQRGIYAATSTGTGSEGGYTVPTEVYPQVADAMKEYSSVRQIAQVMPSDSGAPVNFPTSDGTAETGELVPENTAATAADPTFGVATLTTYKFSSKIITVPYELLQDSAVDIEAFVRNRIAQRLGRITNTYFTTGTGTAQPWGIVAGATAGKVGTTGQTTTVIYDDLIDLIHSVDPAYRNSGRARFAMNDQVLKVLRKLKDGDGRPIFLPAYDLQAGMGGDRLLGYPVSVNQAMAVPAANAKTILFGDFNYFIIRDVMAMTLFRFTDSAYTKYGQVGFLAWMRTGAVVTDTGAVKYYAHSAT